MEPLLRVVRPDGRQSETALSIQRGVTRLLRAYNHAMLTEFTLPSGRRADVISLSLDGRISITEIKSSPEDFHVDSKWPEYREFCDFFAFAIPVSMNLALIPESAGLIVADQWGAEIIRASPEIQLSAARRKAVVHSFARVAAHRLQGLVEGEQFVL